MSETSPIQFHGIDHVVFRVTDIERSLAFYTGVLGLALERVIDGPQIYQIRCGRNLIDLHVLPAGRQLADRDARGYDHVCLLMHGDFEAMLAHLRAHDVPIVWGPVELYGASGYGTSVYVSDPDGHTLELKADYALRPVHTGGGNTLATATQ